MLNNPLTKSEDITDYAKVYSENLEGVPDNFDILSKKYKEAYNFYLANPYKYNKYVKKFLNSKNDLRGLLYLRSITENLNHAWRNIFFGYRPSFFLFNFILLVLKDTNTNCQSRLQSTGILVQLITD